METHARFRLHASQLGKWTRCEASVLHEVTAEREGGRDRAEHVAAWIGRAVHAWAAGGEVPEPPDMLRFDAKTPTLGEAEATVRRMGFMLSKFINQWGWNVLEHERYREGYVEGAPDWLMACGTLDLEVAIGSMRCIPDIKTGAGLQSAWLQIGTYGLLHPERVEMGAVIHFPRVKLAEELEPPTVETRDMAPLMTAARGVIRRVGVLLARPEAAVPSPGGWCEYCEHPACAVRAAPWRGETEGDEG